MSDFLPVFQQKLEKEGVEGALHYCQGRTEIIPRRLYVAGLESSKQGLAAVRRAMANVIELEIAARPQFPAAAHPGHRQGRHHGRPVRHRHQHD